MEIWSGILAGIQLALACSSAAALWLSPRLTLWLSDRLREQDAKRSLRLKIFITLMQERATPNGAEAVKAFNAIDVAFAHEPAVRRSWARLLECGGPGDELDQSDRLATLLDAMAASLGFGPELGAVDFERIYAPEGTPAAHPAITPRTQLLRTGSEAG